jgi:hypothetical protein
MQTLKGETVDVAPGSGHQVRIPLQGIKVDGERVLLSRLF